MRRSIAIACLLFLSIVWAPVAYAQDEESQEAAVLQDDGGSMWGITGSVLLGGFDSTSGPTLFEEALGYEAVLTGDMWDIGVARGRPGHSYFRISFFQELIDDGSTTDDGFTRSVTQGVRLQGVKVERVWYLGRSTWPVAPMLTLHGGIGKVQGQVEERNLEFFFDPETGEFGERFGPPQIEDVGNSLGAEWLPTFGVGVGATASIRDRLTLTVTVVELGFLGLAKGEVQAVVWF